MATRGWESATESDMRSRQKRVTLPQVQRSKYRAVKTTVDGITFDSKREAERYTMLKALERVGEISDLELQPRFPLHVRAVDAPVSLIIGEYIADFRYRRAGNVSIVEDAKGFKTPLYRWKKKHV